MTSAGPQEQIRPLARRLALQGKCQTRWKLWAVKFSALSDVRRFFLCAYREGRRGRKRCCVRLCGKSTRAAAKEPRRDASRAKSFKTFHALRSQSWVNSRGETVERPVGRRRHKRAGLVVELCPADWERLSIVWPRPFDPSASLHSTALPLRTTTPRVRLSEALDVPAARRRLSGGGAATTGKARRQLAALRRRKKKTQQIIRLYSSRGDFERQLKSDCVITT